MSTSPDMRKQDNGEEKKTEKNVVGGEKVGERGDLKKG